MSAETKKLLEMLASGQITAEDAEKLLEKLGANGSGSTPPTTTAQPEGGASPQKLRFLRVVVESPGRDQVNIRVPLPFLRRHETAGSDPAPSERQTRRKRH